MRIAEINITPVKPNNGHVAFASVVIEDGIYLGSIAVYTKLDGTYRLLYPTKRLGERLIDVFHPINRSASKLIEQAIFEKCNELFEKNNDTSTRLQK